MAAQRDLEEKPVSYNSWVGGDLNNPRKILKEVPPPPLPKPLGNWRDRDYVAAHSTIEALVRAQYQCGGEPMGDIHQLLVHEPKPLWANQDRMRLPEVDCGHGGGGKKLAKRCCDPRKNCKGIVRAKARPHQPHSARGVPPRPPTAPTVTPLVNEQHNDRTDLDSPPLSPRDQIVNNSRNADKLMDVGIDSEVSPFLHDRLSQLAMQHQSEEQPTCVWVIVEVCMDCGNHGPSLRHDERAYLARFLQLKDAIERMFPRGVAVELLVPRIAFSDACCQDLASSYTSTGNCERRFEMDGYRGVGCVTNRQTARLDCSPAWRPSSSSPSPPTASGPRVKRLQAGQTRIGSFEVYLCCTSSLILEGGTSLITIAKCQGGAAALQACRRKDDFQGMCLASKLKSRAWPVADAVLVKLLAVMPSVNFRVRVNTRSEVPVAGVQISAFQAQAIGSKHQRPTSARTKYEELRMMPGAGTACVPYASGKTDNEGIFEIKLPVYRFFRLQAYHSIYLAKEDRELQITPWSSEATFIADTVIQFWQIEEGNEMVVYCSCPRSTAPPSIGLKPFRGSVELFNGNLEQPDESGYLKGPRDDILKDVELLHCDGWRSATVACDVVAHGTGWCIELGRLHVPKVEASLVTQCCKSGIHGARIFLDGSLIGTTSCAENSKRLSCGARCGEHVIRAEHFLAPDGLKHPFNVVGSTSIGLEVPFPLEKLRFVCVAQAHKTQSPSADLWLVGGDLASWRASPHGPQQGAEVWLWDGELRHGLSDIAGNGESWESVRVQGGVINTSDFESICKEDSDFEQDYDCIFSRVLTFPSSYDEWKPTLHPAGLRHNCAVAHLASSPCAPAIWIAQLSNSSHYKQNEIGNGKSISSNSLSSNLPKSPQESKPHPSIVMRSKCCGAGFEGVRISIGGSDSGITDELGRLQSGKGDANSRSGSACSSPRGWEGRYGRFASELTHIKISGVPPCLLPGNTSEYVIHCRHASNTDVSLDVDCSFWIFWLPPEVEDTTYDDDSDMQDYEANPEGTVWIGGSSAQVPDEARPLAGVLECQGVQIELDGKSIGPWPLCPRQCSQDSEEFCILSDLAIRPSSIDGFTFRPRDPSPLKERCMELGGCEMQRLASCPVVVGYLKAI